MQSAKIYLKILTFILRKSLTFTLRNVIIYTYQRERGETMKKPKHAKEEENKKLSVKDILELIIKAVAAAAAMISALASFKD